MAKVKGIKVEFGDETFVVAPLNCAFLEDNEESFKNFNFDFQAKSQVSFVVDALTASLARNYPDIRREKVREMLDLGNMHEAMEALMDVSGLKRKAKLLGELKTQPETENR